MEGFRTCKVIGRGSYGKAVLAEVRALHPASVLVVRHWQPCGGSPGAAPGPPRLFVNLLPDARVDECDACAGCFFRRAADAPGGAVRAAGGGCCGRCAARA